MTKITKFKIGICQLKVTIEKNANISQARNLIHAAAEQGANLILLPEMWNCPYSADLFAEFAENLNDINSSPSSLMLSEVAYSLGVTIIGGSIPERDASSGRLYNTCCVFGSNGELKAKHRKIHLFDMGKPLPGDVHFKESDTFSAGEKPTVVETDFGCIGIGICHDLRFPELAILYRARGAHLICYPGAFNMSTGEALWELEQRTRAVDNQLYVATCSPCRDSAGSYMIWGHSTVVGPMGEIIGTTGHEETVLIAEIDYAKIQLTRDSFSLENQRRDNVYRFIDLHQESP
ncbi:omega-amidase, chloroplastic-like isoform X2 [Nicotiana tomentosiformis]|uniref:omega-amidase, chloroplastic-like isoform X2 n=1 Tax=Nicotiana tomentosiformis TaxID=4098 RepID=UPI00051BACBB|nr:omega-amidase, chloroplastic-like isoform X2 [Nicotiana tomentosiformis]